MTGVASIMAKPAFPECRWEEGSLNAVAWSRTIARSPPLDPQPAGILRPVALYRIVEAPELTAPVLVAAFDGWIDAGGAASSAAAHLASSGDVVATFDADVLFDYRSRRPTLDIVDGRLTQLSWPEISLKRVRAGQRDLLILAGAEPDFRWHELGGAAVEIVDRLGVVEWISLGAIPAAVPHTRPVPIVSTESREGLLREGLQPGPQGLLRVPSAALSVLELAVIESGTPAVGYYAQVPHYVGGPYPAATIALLGEVDQHLGVSIALDALSEAAIAQRSTLDAAVAQDDEARAYLARLEALPGSDGIPSGEELASEIERFLRDSGGGAGGNPGGGGGQGGLDPR